MIDMNNYKILDVTPHLRIALKEDLLEQYHSKSAGKNFVKTVNMLAQDIAALPLDYKKPLRFSFIVLPAGKEFSDAVGFPIEGGICGSFVQLDENYPLSLCLDDKLFANGYVTCDFKSRIGLTHELAHIVHGGYFRNLGQICEGFAEMFPHYLMGFEESNTYHQKAITTFKEEDMQTMNFVNQNGMFALEHINGHAQQLKSYMSVYLWMLAYTKRLENLHKFNKFEATNFMLNEFSKIDQLDGNSKTKAIADMVQMPVNDLMNSLILQKEGKQHVMQMITLQKLKQVNIISR